jgi:hypothetical protein
MLDLISNALYIRDKTYLLHFAHKQHSSTSGESHLDIKFVSLKCIRMASASCDGVATTSPFSCVQTM